MCLLDLDLSLSPCHLDKLLRLLSSLVLVAFWAEASKFWRCQPLEGQHTASHTQGFCYFCHGFSVHGSCEHLLVAFLHLKLISLQAAEFPKRQRTANPLQEPSHILLPSRPRAAASSSARKPAIVFNWAQTSHFFAANQADTWAEYFRSECIDVRMISSMGVARPKLCDSTCSSRRPVPPSHRSFAVAGRGSAIAAVSCLFRFLLVVL